MHEGHAPEGRGHGHDQSLHGDPSKRDHHDDRRESEGGLVEGQVSRVHFDCFSGIAGDMALAALIDVGVPQGAIEAELAKLELSGVRLETATLLRHGIAAIRLDVVVDDPQPERSYASIRELIAGSRIRSGARERALRVFERLAHAESRIHRVPLEDVHFHEVGGVDAIVDVCGTAIALDWLGASVSSSPLPLGRGFVRTAHGMLPLPAPATVECLAGVPVYGVDVEAELVTPTGAAIVGALSELFTPFPTLRPTRSGFGAGHRELADRPNLLRVVVGVPVGVSSREGLAVVEANVDDMTPELTAHVAERLFEVGALDVWLTPIQMKKGRPGVTISALSEGHLRETVTEVLLSESTSFGARFYSVDRRTLPRNFEEVETPWGRVPVKVGAEGHLRNAAPEWEVCRRLAHDHGVPAKEVMARALAAYYAKRLP